MDSEAAAGFARDGYLIARDVVPARAQAAALTRIDAPLDELPPATGHTGHHFYFQAADEVPELLTLLTGTLAWRVAAALTHPRWLCVPGQVQVALTFPPHDHRPGRGYLEGLTPAEPDGRPGTFTLLAGVVLSDQSRDDMGNLWVWPGTHRQLAAHFTARPGRAG